MNNVARSPAEMSQAIIQLLDLDMQESLILTRQGATPREDHVPVALYRSADDHMRIWLVYKRGDAELSQTPYHGIVDFNDGRIEFGAIDPVNLVLQGDRDPALRLEKDKSYTWSSDGKKTSEILARQR